MTRLLILAQIPLALATGIWRRWRHDRVWPLRVSLFMDGNDARPAEVRAHLAECAECRRDLHDALQIAALVESAEGERR